MEDAFTLSAFNITLLKFWEVRIYTQYLCSLGAGGSGWSARTAWKSRVYRVSQAGNPNTNHSNLTKGALHESLIPCAEYGVYLYLTSIYVIWRV